VLVTLNGGCFVKVFSGVRQERVVSVHQTSTPPEAKGGSLKALWLSTQAILSQSLLEETTATMEAERRVRTAQPALLEAGPTDLRKNGASLGHRIMVAGGGGGFGQSWAAYFNCGGQQLGMNTGHTFGLTNNACCHMHVGHAGVTWAGGGPPGGELDDHLDNVTFPDIRTCIWPQDSNSKLWWQWWKWHAVKRRDAPIRLIDSSWSRRIARTRRPMCKTVHD